MIFIPISCIFVYVVRCSTTERNSIDEIQRFAEKLTSFIKRENDVLISRHKTFVPNSLRSENAFPRKYPPELYQYEPSFPDLYSPELSQYAPAFPNLYPPPELSNQLYAPEHPQAQYSPPARPELDRLYSAYRQTSFYHAINSITKFDDLKCVPRLLCEVAAGAHKSLSSAGTKKQQQTSGSTLKDAVVPILTVLNYVDDSPLLSFVRAALLGQASKGKPSVCLSAYPTCPQDPDQLINYLNNHNEGFFKYLNGGFIPNQPQILPPGIAIRNQPQIPTLTRGIRNQRQIQRPSLVPQIDHNYLENLIENFPEDRILRGTDKLLIEPRIVAQKMYADFDKNFANFESVRPFGSENKIKFREKQPDYPTNVFGNRVNYYDPFRVNAKPNHLSTLLSPKLEDIFQNIDLEKYRSVKFLLVPYPGSDFIPIFFRSERNHGKIRFEEDARKNLGFGKMRFPGNSFM